MALVLEKDDNRAFALQKLCLYLLIPMTFLATVGILSAPYWFDDFMLEGEIAKYLPWAIPIIFFTGLFNILNQRANREKSYKSISLAIVARRLSTVSLQVALGFFGAQALGLVLGNVLGCLVAAVVIAVCERSLFVQKHAASSLQEVAKTHYRFPCFSAPQNLLNMLSNQLPLFMLGYFYGAEVVGAYFFSMRILQLPAALIGQAIRQVFYKEASDLVENIPKLRRLYLKLTGALAASVLVPVVLLFIWGPSLFSFVFGVEWRLAGEFASWMFLWVGVGFINPPSVMLYHVFGMQRCSLIIDCLLFLCRFLALLTGGLYAFGSIETIKMYSCVGVIVNVVIILIIYLKLNVLSSDEASSGPRVN